MFVIPKSIFNASKQYTNKTNQIVKEAITDLLCDTLNISAEILLRSTEYIPVYGRSEYEEKILKNLYIRHIAHNNFKVLTCEEIENSGATWGEVSEYLVNSGSRRLSSEEFLTTNF